MTVAVLSASQEINERIAKMTQELPGKYTAEFFGSPEAVDEYVKENCPELVFIDTTSDCGGLRCFERLGSDYRYRSSAAIVLVPDEGVRMEIDMMLNQSLLLSINRNEFLRNSTRLFKVLDQNSQFILSRFIQNDVGVRETGTFISDNDSYEIVIYTNLLITYMANTGRVDFEGKFVLQTALMEMLMNALEHGNCCVSYDEKTAWLESGHDMLELIAERNKRPEVSAKKIRINYELCADETNFSIKDDGEGFDWRAMLKKDIEPGLHGMGIKMTEGMVKHLTYNECGNEVFFSIEHASPSSFLVMRDFELKDYKAGELVKDFSADGGLLFWVLAGKLRMKTADNAERDVNAQDIFAISDQDFSLTAVEDTHLMTMQKSDLQSFFKRNPSFAAYAQRKGLEFLL